MKKTAEVKIKYSQETMVIITKDNKMINRSINKNLLSLGNQIEVTLTSCIMTSFFPSKMGAQAMYSARAMM